MPLTLYKVPFTFTLTGTRLVAASNPHEASDKIAADMGFDETNLHESNVFWEEGARVTDISCVASYEPPVPFEGDASAEGYEPEDLETKEEHEVRIEREADLAAQPENWGPKEVR